MGKHGHESTAQTALPAAAFISSALLLGETIEEASLKGSLILFTVKNGFGFDHGAVGILPGVVHGAFII